MFATTAGSQVELKQGFVKTRLKVTVSLKLKDPSTKLVVRVINWVPVFAVSGVEIII